MIQTIKNAVLRINNGGDARVAYFIGLVDGVLCTLIAGAILWGLS